MNTLLLRPPSLETATKGRLMEEKGNHHQHRTGRTHPANRPNQRRCLQINPSFLLHSPLLLILLSLRWDTSLALKCKCTQNSPKVPCEHSVCEVTSPTSACLMLDHPHSGRHYACSTSDLKEGECVEKQSKSGANVKVCSCNSSDFCNFKIWPDGREEQPYEEAAEDAEDGENAENESAENEEEVAAAMSDAAVAPSSLLPMPLIIGAVLLLVLLPSSVIGIPSLHA